MPRKKFHKGKGTSNAKSSGYDHRIMSEARITQSNNSEGGWTNDFEWSNERFEQYYKRQGILYSDEDWSQFMAALRRPLPSNFRLPAGKPTTPFLADQINTLYIPSLSHVTFEGTLLDPPFRIPWFPQGLAYQLNAPKRILRKCPEFKKFHEFLVYETNVGNISRQEAVSMIPPLLLDVQPHHVVLDTCASPGSKTAQIVEALHSDGNPIPSGLVVANDSDYSRAGMLVHQSARLPSPCLMVTNLDASCYPNLQVNDSGGSPSTSALQFDRILCDVPCSGDGTLRKNVGIWKRWNVGNGNGLHSLQLRILQRAMKVLKPGGRIVYSTCSMNPVENEAVVGAALNASGGEFSILDASNMLPELKRCPGLSSWTPAQSVRALSDTSDSTSRIQDEQGHIGGKDLSENPEKPGIRFFSSYSDYINFMDEVTPAPGKAELQETLWPPSNAGSLGLERCMRIYPHLQDSGGFFVAVLQKANHASTGVVTPIISTGEAYHRVTPAKRSASSEGDVGGLSKKVKPNLDTQEGAVLEEQDDQKGAAKGGSVQLGKRRKMGKAEDADNIATEEAIGNFNENPYTFLDPLDPVLQESLTKLGISATFPSGNLFVRNPTGEAARIMYLCNDMVKRVVLLNSFERIRLVSCGVKIFARQDGGPKEPNTIVPRSTPSTITSRNSAFRFVQDGVLTVQQFVSSEFKVDCNLGELRRLLETYYPLISHFPEPFMSTIQKKPIGSYLAIVQPGEHQSASLKQPLVLPLWRSGVSLSLMIDKQAKTALSVRLWGEDCTVAARAAVGERIEGKSEHQNQE